MKTKLTVSFARLLNLLLAGEVSMQQQSLLPAIQAHDEPGIKSVVEMIRRYKKGLAQEIFISAALTTD